MSKKNIAIPVIILALIGLAGLGWFYRGKLFPSPSKPEKVYRVGVVSYGGAHDEAIKGLQEGMVDLGYVEGSNIIYDVVNAQGSEQKVGEAVQKFIADKTDAIYSITTPITKIVFGLTKELGLPVVFNVVSDPVGSGYAKSFSSSGTNMTGCSNIVGETGGKRLEIFKQIIPGLKRVLVLYDPKNKFAQDGIALLRPNAKALGIILIEKLVYSKEDVIKTMEEIRPGEYDGFFHLGEAKVSGAAEDVIRIANEKNLPTLAHEVSFAEKGMLAVYGPSWRLLGRQCAWNMDNVLKGVKPTDIPIQAPEKLDLVVNLKTAANLGIEIPKEVLIKTDRIIK